MGDLSCKGAGACAPSASQPLPKQAERLPDCSRIYPRDFVYVPEDCYFRVHEVKRGESLWRIAQRHKVKAEWLCALEENAHLRVTGAGDPMRGAMKTKAEP